jgi:hypothetical protein
MHYTNAVRSGEIIHSPDPSDPIDAQQVFVDSALLQKVDCLEAAKEPEIELPHILFDCIDELMGKIIAKCEKDIPTGTKVALLGGMQINSGEGLPDYFLPKKFLLLDSKGKLLNDLLPSLAEEGSKDPRALLHQRKQNKSAATPKAAKTGGTFIDISIDPKPN